MQKRRPSLGSEKHSFFTIQEAIGTLEDISRQLDVWLESAFLSTYFIILNIYIFEAADLFR